MQHSVIPSIGLGTFGLTGPEGLDAMSAAIQSGYIHLDTAQSYDTEANVGAAVRQAGVDRGDIFVTTKVGSDNLLRVGESVEESLATLEMDYVDLLLIHWPAPNEAFPVSRYIGDLVRMQDAGKARLVGVSNFTRRHIDSAIAEIGSGRLATNQFEQHVFLQNRVLAAHCRDAGIAVTAYMPIVGGRLARDPSVKTIARKHAATPSQVGLAYLLQMESIVIPKSADPDRQRSNLAATDLSLDAEDIVSLDALDRGERHIDPDWGPDWD